MIEFVIGFILGIVAAGIIVRIMAQLAIKRFERALDSVLTDLKENDSSLIIRARVEEENGVFYFYNNDSNEFLVQGSNLQELLEHLESRKLGTTVHVVKGEESTIAQLKALSR